MSDTVWKFTVPVDDNWHGIPGFIVHAACLPGQVNAVTIWAEVDPDERFPLNPYRVFGTGQSLPPQVKHIRTAVAADGALVWHVYASTRGPR